MMERSGLVVFLFLLLSLVPPHTHSDLIEDVRRELKDDLYSLSDLLPGFIHSTQQATSLAVVDMRVKKEDDKLLGKAISELLRFRIQFVPGMPLYMPAFAYTHVDAGLSGEARPLVNVESFRNLQSSLGIENILTGSISMQGTAIEMNMELLNSNSGSLIKSKIWKAPRNSLTSSIIEISKWVYSTLNVQLTPDQLAYLEQRDSLSAEAMSEYLNAFPKLVESNRRSRHELSKKLATKHTRFALFAHHTLTSRIYANSHEDVYKNLDLYERLVGNFPRNPGISLESYRALEVDMLPKHKVSRSLDRMKRLVVENPGDPTILLNYSDILIKNGNTLDGISILLEALDIWPQQYRLWWSLGWALNSHAWQVRGDKFWRDVPQRQQNLFLALSVLADRVIDQAIAMNPHNGDLLNMKINSLGSLNGYSDELLQVFDQAVEVAPESRKIYQSAMNFSQSKWGGTAIARKHIITTAEHHNPGTPWVEAMKRVHAADLENFQDRLADNPVMKYMLELLDHPNSGWVLIIGGILVFWVVYSLGRKSAFDEVHDYIEQDTEEDDDGPVQR